VGGCLAAALATKVFMLVPFVAISAQEPSSDGAESPTQLEPTPDPLTSPAKKPSDKVDEGDTPLTPDPLNPTKKAGESKTRPTNQIIVAVPGVCLDPDNFPPPAPGNPAAKDIVYQPQRNVGDPFASLAVDLVVTTRRLQDEDRLQTPYTANPQKEQTEVAQNAVWAAGRLLDDDPTNDVTPDALTNRVFEQIEKQTGKSKDQFPEPVQQAVTEQALLLFGSISTVMKETPGVTPPPDSTASSSPPEKPDQPTEGATPPPPGTTAGSAASDRPTLIPGLGFPPIIPHTPPIMWEPVPQTGTVPDSGDLGESSAGSWKAPDIPVPTIFLGPDLNSGGSEFPTPTPISSEPEPEVATPFGPITTGEPTEAPDDASPLLPAGFPPIEIDISGHDTASGPRVFDLAVANESEIPIILTLPVGTIFGPTGDAGGTFQREVIPTPFGPIFIPPITSGPTPVSDRPIENETVPVPDPHPGSAAVGGDRTTIPEFEGEEPDDSPSTSEVPLDDPQAGDPVYLHSGEVFQSVVDLEFPGRGFNWRFHRRYRSQINYDGPLGRDWDFNYNKYLRSVGPYLVYYDGQARAFTYAPGRWPTPDEDQADDAKQSPIYVCATGASAPIHTLKDGRYLLRTRNGFRYTFRPLGIENAPGMVESIADADGNTMRMTYNASGQLTTVVDTLGRPVRYEYFEDGRLSQVVDFTGRSLRFTYDEQGHLVEVARPSITGTPTRNDFPQGRRFRYAYVLEHESPDVVHNLESITAPQDVEAGRPPRVVFEYDHRDRVMAQHLGGTNASGVEAGGTIRYRYYLMPQPESLSPTTPVFVTRFVDRKGHVTDLLFNRQGLLVERHEYRPQGQAAGDQSSKYVTYFVPDSYGRIERITYPGGNQRAFHYDVRDPLARDPEVVIDIPDSQRGAQQGRVIRHYAFEPVFGRLLREVDPRGLDENYQLALPDPAGRDRKDRYTTLYFLDYQEDRSKVEIGGQEFYASLPRLAEQMGYDQTEPDVLLRLGRRLARAGVYLGLGDLNGDGKETTAAAGHVVRVEHPALIQPGEEGPDAKPVLQPVTTRHRYNEFGQHVVAVDPTGRVTEYTYYPANDPEGDGTPTPGVAKTSNGGYVHTEVVGAESVGENPAVRLTTEYLYDQHGYVRGVVDGRGVRTDYIRNQIGEIVLLVQAAALARDNSSEGAGKKLGTPAYRTGFFWDANSRVVKAAVESRDEALAAGVGRTLDYEYVYDILDMPVEIRYEIAEGQYQTFRLRYDKNQNLASLQSPVCVAGEQPANRITFEWDERDKLVSRTRGEGATASTERWVRDANGNVAATVDAEDNDGDGQPESTAFVYDGYDRLIAVLDPMGGRVEFDRGPGSVVTEVRRFGTPGGESSAEDATAAVLLARTVLAYNELDRVVRRDDYVSPEEDAQPAGSKAFVSTHLLYDATGREIHLLRGRAPTDIVYDSAGRTSRVSTIGSETQLTYDGNSNIVYRKEIERDAGGRVQRDSAAWLVYDAMNQVVRITDSLGQTVRFAYGSNGRLNSISSPRSGDLIDDPLGLYPGKINAPGSLLRRHYDGLGRVVRQEYLLAEQGAEPLTEDQIVKLKFAWDLNNRLIAMTDDNGRTTRYAYDEQNRPATTTDASGKAARYEYNRDGQLVRYTDRAGSVATTTFDALGRMVARHFDPAEGVVGTTDQRFDFDGLGRLWRALDSTDPTRTDDDIVTARAHDGLSRVVNETQWGAAVGQEWLGPSELRKLTYPGGQRLTQVLDALQRPTEWRYSEREKPIVNVEYLGLARALRQTYGNGLQQSHVDAAGKIVGLDGLGRPVESAWSRAGQPILEHRRRLDRTGRVAGGGDSFGSFTTAHDLLGRLVQFDWKPPAKDGVVSSSARRSWTLDGAGNWQAVQANERIVKSVVNLVNAYTEFAGQTQKHDTNGNRTADARFTYHWDALNRLREVRRARDGEPVATYDYDALDRRVRKQVANGDQTRETRFFYSGWQCVEEQNGEGRTMRQYIYGQKLDDLLAVAQFDSEQSPRLLYVHRDDRPHNVVAVTDEAGDIVDRFAYLPHGEMIDLGDDGGDWPLRYHSRRLDPETGLYYFRNRYYDPEQGRFLSQDPLGTYGDSHSAGNAYAFAGNQAMSAADPLGLWWKHTSKGPEWMGTPGKEDYGLTTVWYEGAFGSWIPSPDYVWEIGSDPGPREPSKPPAGEPIDWEGYVLEALGANTGDGAFWGVLNGANLPEKYDVMLKEFIFDGVFSLVGSGGGRAGRAVLHRLSLKFPIGRDVSKLNISPQLKKFAQAIQQENVHKFLEAIADLKDLIEKTAPEKQRDQIINFLRGFAGLVTPGYG